MVKPTSLFVTTRMVVVVLILELVALALFFLLIETGRETSTRQGYLSSLLGRPLKLKLH